MAKQAVTIGVAPGDGSGDTIKQACVKNNANFVEIYGGEWNPASFQASRFVKDSGALNTIGAYTYTLLSSDNGKTLAFTYNSALIALTVPAGLPVGFTCHIYQGGTSKVVLVPSGTTIHHPLDHTATSGQYGMIRLYEYAANTYLLTGSSSLVPSVVNVYTTLY